MAKSSITQQVPFRNKGIEKMSIVEVPYYTAEDVQKLLGIGSSKAYNIIKQLNDELKSKGFITVAGKVSKKYFRERVAL